MTDSETIVVLGDVDGKSGNVVVPNMEPCTAKDDNRAGVVLEVEIEVG